MALGLVQWASLVSTQSVVVLFGWRRRRFEEEVVVKLSEVILYCPYFGEILSLRLTHLGAGDVREAADGPTRAAECCSSRDLPDQGVELQGVRGHGGHAAHVHLLSLRDKQLLLRAEDNTS